MKTIKNSSTLDLIEKATIWAEMTADNAHSEVLLDIATFFEYSSYVEFFFPYILKDSLTMAETTERYGKAEIMMDKILEDYGTTIYTLVKKGL